MLKRATLHEAQLKQAMIIASDNPRMIYYSDGYWDYDLNLSANNWDAQEFVSLDSSDNLLGFFCGVIERKAHYISSLSIISFEDNPSWEFHKDFRDFILKLFVDYKYNKLKFHVSVGNPTEKLYDKFIKRFGGRIVGVFKDDCPLEDGTLVDRKDYEIFRDSFYEHANKYIERYKKCQK